MSKVDDFMFIWRFNDEVDKYGLVVDHLQNHLSTNIFIRIDRFKVVIMNKDCKIQGYLERWRMPVSM